MKPTVAFSLAPAGIVRPCLRGSSAAGYGAPVWLRTGQPAMDRSSQLDPSAASIPDEGHLVLAY